MAIITRQLTENDARTLKIILSNCATIDGNKEAEMLLNILNL